MISGLFLGALLALGSCAVAAPTSPLHNTTHTCGSTPSPEEVAAAQAHFLQHKVTPQPNPALSAPIPVYFHVIYDNPNGNVPDAQIIAQMGVLNANFAPTGRSFILGGVTRTYNPSWFNFAGPGTVFQTAMKSTLHIGGAASLNIYTVGFVNIAQPGLLGYATFPWQYAAAPLDDGVVLHYATLPGGAATLNNLGRVGTHEVGHWVGLLHTFEGGCFGPGDYVDDTPAEATAASGCPVGRKTCPGPGLDPINNYMDYTIDACRNQFTFGQANRLLAMLATYRGV